ncbi:MAG: hypothetical protein ACPH3N_03940 [Alcanivorax sediminis]|uniref:hypothetical protein n=1 Tax=Alcanivorax sediminis TaxID=2663008 RepID=UPI003C647156
MIKPQQSVRERLGLGATDSKFAKLDRLLIPLMLVVGGIFFLWVQEKPSFPLEKLVITNFRLTPLDPLKGVLGPRVLGRAENRSDSLVNGFEVVLTLEECAVAPASLDLWNTNCLVIWQGVVPIDVRIPPKQARDFVAEDHESGLSYSRAMNANPAAEKRIRYTIQNVRW